MDTHLQVKDAVKFREEPLRGLCSDQRSFTLRVLRGVDVDIIDKHMELDTTVPTCHHVEHSNHVHLQQGGRKPTTRDERFAPYGERFSAHSVYQ